MSWAGTRPLISSQEKIPHISAGKHRTNAQAALLPGLLASQREGEPRESWLPGWPPADPIPPAPEPGRGLGPLPSPGVPAGIPPGALPPESAESARLTGACSRRTARVCHLNPFLRSAVGSRCGPEGSLTGACEVQPKDHTMAPSPPETREPELRGCRAGVTRQLPQI